LPDDITLPLLWLGLTFNLGHTLATLSAAVIGALAGYLSLWLVYQGFKLLTGKEGMGFGDFKLFAAAGAWMGYAALLPVIIIAALSGAVIGTILLRTRGHDRSMPFAFGPFLAIAMWIWLVAGDPILATYMRLVGLN
jgi:leader peptidase (prepilin peptidase)/N-methyltransferase